MLAEANKKVKGAKKKPPKKGGAKGKVKGKGKKKPLPGEK
eukprot:CAMPEP_0201284046 /NCGR_PEP_ID=MMETSP1317-20130820/59197_1 /ASSEMBLY_ACC=CAM_ASM_000770 /TAXON_ID=187299 /ORGANISM="Undescribed Undescribed, Strain Undescribed" /LENGTH=39 /DNA_ID= /DNA_START= /DNA_END= /DNA_ORIENTATION=